jgi:plastocyanin
MKALRLLFLGCCAWLSAEADVTVVGRVTLPHRHTVPVLNQRYEIVARGGILAPNPPLAIVYLAGPFPRPAQVRPAQMAQLDLEFVPTLLAVQAGTRVEFPNQDDTYHNIFSYSAAKRFDLGRYRSDERPIPSVLFDTPGLITLHCDIHEHMRALILVLDTPYFAITDAEGNFRLEHLPPGRHVLKAWLDSKTTLEHPLELVEARPGGAPPPGALSDAPDQRSDFP